MLGNCVGHNRSGKNYGEDQIGAAMCEYTRNPLHRGVANQNGGGGCFRLTKAQFKTKVQYE